MFPNFLVSFWVMIFFLLFVICELFWFWTLVDVLQRKKFEDKLVWVIMLIVFNVFASVMYYFMVYKELEKKTKRKNK